MSISQLSSSTQTGLIPNVLVGYSSTGNNAIQVNASGIVLGGNLLTTPRYVTIGDAGLSSTNPNGLQVISPIDMNQNIISNVSQIALKDTDDITTSTITQGTTGDLTINASSNQLILNSYDNVGINAGVGLLVVANDYISMTANNDNISFTADDDISLTSVAKGIILNAGTGDGGNNDITLTTIASTLIGNIVFNSAGAINITSTTEINIVNPTDTWFNSTTPNTGDGIVYASFYGYLTGVASSASTIEIIDNNTSATYYPTFVSNNTGNLQLQVDKTTNPLSYIPSTGNLTSTLFTGLLSTGGLVYLSTGSVAITGLASSTNFSLADIFNSTYKNYRIVLAPTTQVTFTAYPSYGLQAFLGTGTMPTTASLYGFEMTSSNSALVSPVYTAGATIASSPLILAVSQTINHQTIIEVENVGFFTTAGQSVGLKCKSFYGNPGISGASDRSILASVVSGSTITGLTLQQSSISVGNNMSIGYTIYGYK